VGVELPSRLDAVQHNRSIVQSVDPNPPPHGHPVDLISALEAARAAEKAQSLFYRALAAEAENRGDEALSERFNELHADEQHHVSRLTARLLELGAPLADIADLAGDTVPIEGWEAAAAAREAAEVARYERLLEMEMEMDAATRALVGEILDTERHQAAELGGKWTTA
jgi:ferritin-like protein